MPSSRKKKGSVTLADVVRELGPLGPGKKLSPKRSAAAGGALQNVHPQLTSAAATSLANHMYKAQLDPKAGDLSLDALMASLAQIFPQLAQPEQEEPDDEPPMRNPDPPETPKVEGVERQMSQLTSMDVNRSDYPAFARPYGDVAEDEFAQGGKHQPTPKKKAKPKGGALGAKRDGGYGGPKQGTGGRHLSLRSALKGS